MKNKIRAIAIHLPQFHPFKENDDWWGKGFTEWINVTKSKPRFMGHYQPHLPADLGFYDLRLEEARLEQEKLAKEYGLHGFCYYHYWFNGKRLMETPVERKLNNPKEDFPFMLCWANENWTRAWDGKNKDVLIEQDYNDDDDRNHMKTLIPYFKDERYIKIEGKPVFAIYKSTALPNMKRTIEIWREEARKEGIELYLCRFESLKIHGEEYLKDGFDAAIEFQPHVKVPRKYPYIIASALVRFDLRTVYEQLKIRFLIRGRKLSVVDYRLHVRNSLLRYKTLAEYKLYRCVVPGWDNSPRRKKHAYIMKNSTPEIFESYVKDTLEGFTPYSEEENLFFVNAWNEWAEGNHLEPCQKWGRRYLEAFKSAIEKYL